MWQVSRFFLKQFLCFLFFPVFFVVCRTACEERGCLSNPRERAALSPAEAGAEALKLAFESLSVEDKRFCVDAPVPTLSPQQVGDMSVSFQKKKKKEPDKKKKKKKKIRRFPWLETRTLSARRRRTLARPTG
jgi:hypothetical protein